MKYFLLALSAVMITIAACKKVETPPNAAQKLRGKDGTIKWEPNKLVLTYYGYMGDDSATFVQWEKKKAEDPDKDKDTRPDCIKDDAITFKEVNDGEYLPGGNKCVSSETDNIQFTWGLSDNDKKLYIYGLYSFFGGDANGLLQELADDHFVFAYPSQIADQNKKMVPVRYTMTLSKR